jgi:hypothetical protein
LAARQNGVGFICPSVNPPSNCPTTAKPVLDINDAESNADGPEFIQNINTAAGAHSVVAIFIPEKKGKGVINKVYVPLRVTPGVETGGLGVVGRIP